MTLKIGGSHHESRCAFWREPMNFGMVCAGAAALGALLAQPVHAEDTLKLTVVRGETGQPRLPRSANAPASSRSMEPRSSFSTPRAVEGRSGRQSRGAATVG